MKKNKPEIIAYRPALKQHFINLNLEWLEYYFEVEPHDQEVLYQCEEQIILPGGHIFFLNVDQNIVGTYAFLPQQSPGVFELTKMAVLPSERGKGYGNLLMKHSLRFAKEYSFQKIILYSSRKLTNAIHLYEKYGFTEIPIEENGPYARGDIKMEINFS